MYEFHVSRLSRELYHFDQSIFRFDGNVIFTDFLAARRFTQKINQKRNLVNYPEQAVKASDINAIGLIDEILHLVITLYRQQIDENIFNEAYTLLKETFGTKKLHQALLVFVNEFPPISVYTGDMSAEMYLKASTDGIPHTHITLEEMLMLWITNQNPAVSNFSELFDDTVLEKTTIYHPHNEILKNYFAEKPHFGPDNQDLYTMLRSPALAEPYSLSGQLEYIRLNWGALMGNYLYRLLISIDLLHEETKVVFDGQGPTYVPTYLQLGEEENFSPDSAWMPRTVMIAKNTYVWLYQLSQIYHREIKHLDEIPDEELDKLARWGFNGLWLIGLWERSKASKRIKQLCGNPEAVASAYSLKNYRISEDLGGEESYQRLREKAWQRGIRLASDMVPNHMGIDSDWVIDHPDWFISLPHTPFPAYSFSGQDLSPTDQVTIKIEDHYYGRTDAAVVFMHVDKVKGETRFIYHGNDGTSMPWNDTAQLNYLKEEVREAVIQTILHVARKFPIIRFDAAMTLAKKHYQRLWFPRPGTGGDIASRSEFGLTADAFDQAFPKEFWREVVDRVADEVPDTLLLAEAFWMMEGYFVRTLGMHRVYNSAFMNMLRNEENSKYRAVIKNTLEFEPEILKRYVNFMNNPDEKTAVEQFGKDDKYFGICTLMATMPGLPMFGHGQIEGFAEKYGMEYYRPYWDEKPDTYLIQRHQKEIFPLLKRRDLYSGVDNFLLYDFFTDDGKVNEDVFVYSNGNGNQRSLMIYHNKFGSTGGWVNVSASYLNKKSNNLETTRLIDGLCLSSNPANYVIFRDIASGLEFIRSIHEIEEKGLHFDLNAYQCHVFTDFREVADDAAGQYAQVNAYLNGRGVPSIDAAIREIMLSPILRPIQDLINADRLNELYQARIKNKNVKINTGIVKSHTLHFQQFIEAIKSFINVTTETQPIVLESQRGMEAILNLQYFDQRYPFPKSENYLKVLDFIQDNLGSYPFIWYVLFMWNDLRLIGRVVTSKPQFAEISRSWFDEWGISKLVQNTLENLGLETQQAISGVTILKLLISEQNWLLDINNLTPISLIENWLAKDEIRRFLDINRYREVLWFSKEAYESMLWWMTASGLVRLVAEPETSLTEAVEAIYAAYDIVQTLKEAEAGSEYQVEKLLDGLK